jgi:hypothetical protein
MTPGRAGAVPAGPSLRVYGADIMGTDLRAIMNGRHWVFLCFSPAAVESLQALLNELVAAGNKTVTFRHAYIPPGRLWNRRECNVIAVPKADVGYEDLAPGLRKHLGYECPEATADVFTLGVTPEEDAELDRVGLFGKRK